jgi:uracil-DNA glycosylase
MANTWSDILAQEKQKDYFINLMKFVQQERDAGKRIYPPASQVFAALKLTPFDQVKVVILGQDPYHGPNQAHGLAFSVNKGIPLPPSLRNIYKEIEQDIGQPCAPHGDLTQWAEQGVLLLNTVLTVEEGKAHSHKDRGWERFTDCVISGLNHAPQHIVFLLWGSHAQKKSKLIDSEKHTVLTAPHPSPLSAHRGFLGCQHFSLANRALADHQQQPIDWVIQ